MNALLARLNSKSMLLICLLTLSPRTLEASPPTIRLYLPNVANADYSKISLRRVNIFSFIKDASQTKLVVNGPDQSDNYKVMRLVTTIRMALLAKKAGSAQLHLPYDAACSDRFGVADMAIVKIKQNQKTMPVVAQAPQEKTKRGYCEKSLGFRVNLSEVGETKLTIYLEYDALKADPWQQIVISGYKQRGSTKQIACKGSCPLDFVFNPGVVLGDYAKVSLTQYIGNRSYKIHGDPSQYRYQVDNLSSKEPFRIGLSLH